MSLIFRGSLVAGIRPAADLTIEIVFCHLFMLVFVVTSIAATNSDVFGDSRTVTTKVVGGFFLGVRSDSTDAATAEDRLILVPWTTNDAAWFAIPAEPEYSYQVEAFDAMGVSVSKTDLGTDNHSQKNHVCR